MSSLCCDSLISLAAKKHDEIYEKKMPKKTISFYNSLFQKISFVMEHFCRYSLCLVERGNKNTTPNYLTLKDPK